MKTIYIITSGDYSDYRINAVFDTEAAAQTFVNNNTDEYHIEEYTVNEKANQLKQGLTLYEVWMRKDGTVESVIRPSYEMEKLYTVDVEDQTLTIQALAKDEKHAIKIANERRRVAILEGAFKTKHRTKEMVTGYTRIAAELVNNEQALEVAIALQLDKIVEKTGAPLNVVKLAASVEITEYNLSFDDILQGRTQEDYKLLYVRVPILEWYTD